MKELSHAIHNGLTLVASHWGGSGSMMSWLDSPPCSGHENCVSGVAKWSNIKIRTSNMQPNYCFSSKYIDY